MVSNGTCILRFRAVFIWLIVAMTFFMFQQSKKAELSYTMARLLPSDSETQLDYNYFVEHFGERDNIMIIGVQDSTFLNLIIFFLGNNSLIPFEVLKGLSR